MTTLQDENVGANFPRVDADVRPDGSMDLWKITDPDTPQEDAGFAVRLSPGGWGTLAGLYALEHPDTFVAIIARLMRAHSQEVPR